MCTIVKEALKPFDRTSRIKCIEMTLDPDAFFRIAKRSIG